MAHKEGFLRDMDLLAQQAKEAEEDRLASQREYEQRVNETDIKRKANKRAATEAHQQWLEGRDELINKPYTEDAEARRQASLQYDKDLRDKRQKTLGDPAGGRRMKYKSTRRRSKSTRRRGKTNRRRVKTHRRRHRKH